MSALSLRNTVLGMVSLLFVACDEEARDQRGVQHQDRRTTESVEAVTARIDDLETRLAALEQRVTEIAGLRGLSTGGDLPRRGDRLRAAQTPRHRSSLTGTQSREAAQQSAGPGQVVDFTKASEGQVFPQYGSRNMVVETSAGLGLTSASREPVNLVFSDFSVAERIEVMVSLRTGFWTDQKIRLLNDDRAVIAVTLSNYDLSFGDHVKKRSITGWKRGEERNQLRIVIENSNAWLYVNDRFFGVQAIEFVKANRLEISGIKRDQDFVYSVSVQPLS
jgi:PAS domain-containing protein